MLADWQMWSGCLAAETCNDIIEAGLKLPVHQGAVSEENHISETVRSSEIRWMWPMDERPLFEVLWHYAKWANRNAFAFDIDFLPSVQFTTYNVTRVGGHYDWHQDTFFVTKAAMHRKLSMVVQLSPPETYEGCDLELDCSLRPHYAELRAQGTIIVFPSFMFHRVTPLLKGTRHSLVAWFEGPKWR